jgi:hypothetical protein
VRDLDDEVVAQLDALGDVPPHVPLVPLLTSRR